MTVLPVVFGNGVLLPPDGTEAQGTFALNSTVTLSVQNRGAFDHVRWVLRRAPEGSVSALSSTESDTPTIGPLDAYDRWSLRCIGYDSSGAILGSHVFFLYVVSPNYNLRQLAEDENFRLDSAQFREIINQQTRAIQDLLAGGGGGGGFSGDALSLRGVALDAPTLPAPDGSLWVYDAATGHHVLKQITQDQVLSGFQISSFTKTAGVAILEAGAIITNPAFGAGYQSHNPTSAVLTRSTGGSPLNVSSTPTAFVDAGTFQRTTIGNVVWTLTADGKTAQVVQPWGDRIYWGVSAQASGYDAAFVQGLASSAIKNSRAHSLTFSAGTDKYGFVWVPDELFGPSALPSFLFGAAPLTLDDVGAITVPALNSVTKAVVFGGRTSVSGTSPWG
jgi:hypothetical protein